MLSKILFITHIVLASSIVDHGLLLALVCALVIGAEVVLQECCSVTFVEILMPLCVSPVSLYNDTKEISDLTL